MNLITIPCQDCGVSGEIHYIDDEGRDATAKCKACDGWGTLDVEPRLIPQHMDCEQCYGSLEHGWERRRNGAFWCAACLDRLCWSCRQKLWEHEISSRNGDRMRLCDDCLDRPDCLEIAKASMEAA